MTNSGGYSNADNKAAELDNDADDATAKTESGEIDTGANSKDLFSDSAPGRLDSAGDNGSKTSGTDGEDGVRDGSGE